MTQYPTNLYINGKLIFELEELTAKMEHEDVKTKIGFIDSKVKELNIFAVTKKEKLMEKRCNNCDNGFKAKDGTFECALPYISGYGNTCGYWTPKEKPMNKIEELEEIIKEAQSKIKEIESQCGEDNWEFIKHYYVDDDMKSESLQGLEDWEKITTFRDLKGIYNYFKKEKHAELWARKFNAQLKLWHIAQKLNDGWKPVFSEDGYFYFIDETYNIDFNELRFSSYQYFKSEKLAEKAQKLMGDMLEDLYLEIY